MEKLSQYSGINQADQAPVSFAAWCLYSTDMFSFLHFPHNIFVSLLTFHGLLKGEMHRSIFLDGFQMRMKRFRPVFLAVGSLSDAQLSGKGSHRCRRFGERERVAGKLLLEKISLARSRASRSLPPPIHSRQIS